jgi:transposase
MKGNKSYTESLKREVFREVQLGNISKEDAKKKYDIRGHSAVSNWIRKFEEEGSLSKIKMMDYKKENKDGLIKRIKELERQLEDEKIRAEGYSKMIDIAEDQLKISIRKKSITKQSKN